MSSKLLSEERELTENEISSLINRFLFSSKIDVDNLPSLTQEEVDEIFNIAATKIDQQEFSQISHSIQLEEDVQTNHSPIKDQQHHTPLQQSSSSIFEENIISITGQKRPFAAIQRSVLDEPETDTKKQKLLDTELQSNTSLFQITPQSDPPIPSIFSNEEPQNI